MKKKDAFYELLKFYLANDVYSFEQKQGDPVLFSTISSDHCPLGYKGIRVYIKETELREGEK